MTWRYEYSRSNRENFPFPIQTKLSKNNKRFAVLYLIFWYLHEISNVVKKKKKKKKNEPERSNISEVIDSETCAYLSA